MIQRIYLFICFACFSLFLYPVGLDDMKFTLVGMDKGLSQGTVFDIVQDKKGNMWFATNNGVNKFNGYTFTVYQHDVADSASIANNAVRTLLVDSNGDIWAGTRSGLSYYDKMKDRFLNFEYLKEGRQLGFQGIVEVDSLHLLLITKDELLLFNIVDRTFEELALPVFKSPMLLSMLVKEEGVIYLGAKEGLFTYTPQNRIIKQVWPKFDGRLVNAVRKCTKSDELYVGTEGSGLYKINFRTQKMKNYRHLPGNSRSLGADQVRTLAFDDQNRLWVGTFESLSIYDEENDSFTSYHNDPLRAESLSQNSVRCIFRDRQGGMWLGTYWGGVNYWHTLKNRFHNIRSIPYQNSLSSPIVNCIAEDSNSNLWIGTDGGGLNCYNPQNNRFTSYPLHDGKEKTVNSNNVKAVHIDEKRGLVFAGAHAGGLAIFHLKTGKMEYFHLQNSTLSDQNVYAIIPDGEEALWLGTLSTLIRFHIKDRTFTPVQKQKDGTHFPSKRIKVLFRDSKQRIWVGAENGLHIYQQLGGEVQLLQLLPQKSPLNHMVINCIYEGHDRIFWIGSHEGLYAFDEQNQQIMHYTRRNGLVSDVISGIKEDFTERLWISSNEGLTCFNRSSNTFRNYTEIDGLQEQQFNTSSCCRVSDGRMYFGGLMGITFFDPEKLVDNPYTPAVTITDLQLFGKSVRPDDDTGILQKSISETDHIELHSWQTSFSLDFVVSNYISGGHNTFSYQLKGYDKVWYTSDRRTVSYTNLPHGTYYFLVKAANSDGKWNNVPTQLKIVILPMWYNTWWAYLLFVIVGLSVIAFIFRFLWIRKTMQAQLEFEWKDKEQREKLNQMKIQFFINMSHELRTPLTLILAPIQDVLNRIDDQWARTQLKYAQRNGQKLLHHINQLMDYRQAELGVFRLQVRKRNVCRLMEEVFASYERLAQKRKIDYNLFVELTDEEKLFDAKYFELIADNLVSNAFKYTTDGKTITVRLKEENDVLILSVSDTGIGIAADKQKKIFEQFYQVDNIGNGNGIGLSLVKKLIEFHHGKITLQSEEGVGSIFSVYFPQEVSLYKEEEWIATENESSALGNSSWLIDDSVLQIAEKEKKQLVMASKTDQKDKERILIVEDNEEIRQYLVEGLSTLFEVCQAGNGEEAWGILNEQEVDVVVTDVMMPVMDGVKLTKLIKRNIRTCHVFVLVLTAKTEIEHQLEGLQVGADDYIPKPFLMNILVLKIRNFIRAKYRILDHYAQSMEIDPQKLTFNAMDEAFLQKAVGIVEANLGNPDFSTDDFTSEINMGRTALHLKMKAITGESTTDFVRKIRFNKACNLLREGRYTIAEISVMVGYSSPSYFTTSFKKYVGCSPGEYTRGKR